MLPALELKDCHQLNIVIALLKIVKKHMNWSSIQLHSEDGNPDNSQSYMNRYLSCNPIQFNGYLRHYVRS